MNTKLSTLVLFSLLLAVDAASAHTVTLNYAFHIGADKDNIIHVNDTDFNATQANLSAFTALDRKFITSERTGVVFGLVFAGKTFLNASLNTTYTAADYILQMKQSAERDRFLVTFTNGTWRNIDNAAAQSAMPSKTFGDIIKIARAVPLFIRAEYDTIDINNRLRWDGSAKIAIRNQGIVNGLTNVTLTFLNGG